jgi:hypothetical protein
MNVTCQLDMRNLANAHKILMRHTSKSPGRCINSTAYHVIKDVVEYGGGFPVVAQSTIDADMEVTVTPKLVTTGPRAGKPLKSGATDIEVPDFSAAMLIVIARMNPLSKYSLSTGNRWPVPTPGGKGAKAMIQGFAKAYGSQNAMAMFFDAIRDTAERMVRARHSSTGFLKHSWTELKGLLAPYATGKAGIRASVTDADFAEIGPAKEGNLAVCTVSNTLGVNPGASRTAKELAEKYNAANHRIGVTRLRDAINREFESKMRLIEKKGLSEEMAALQACGMLVRLT